MKGTDFLPRAITPTLKARLRTFPVVIVTGARQTGKSTLARHLGGTRRAYLTLDDFDLLDQANAAPMQLLQRHPRLTVDEVQRAPDLLLAIKRAVDERRENGRFLLTGSANLMLMNRVSESLAGRAVYVALWPMSAGEADGRGVVGRWDSFFDLEPEAWQAAFAGRRVKRRDWMELARRGGYPVPTLQLAKPADRAAWFDGYVRTYLERDLQQLAAIDNLIQFRRLIRAACLRIGGLLNRAELARDTGIAPTTAQRYLELLETSYQLVTLQPYAVNRTKRLVKSPKLYWSDTGLALHVSGEERPRGAHLENLILCDLLAWSDTRVPRPQVLFWRTSKGAEVDFVIELAGRILPIEVKVSRRIRSSDVRHLRTFLKEYGDLAQAAILLYDGDEAYWLDDRVFALPWWRLI